MDSTQSETELDVGADCSGYRAEDEDEDEDEDDQEDADIHDMIAALMFLTVDKSGPEIVDVD